MAKYQSFREAANHSEKLMVVFQELSHRFPPQTSEAEILAALEQVGEFEGGNMPDGLQLLQALRHQFVSPMGDIDLDSLTYTLQNCLVKQHTPPPTEAPATPQDKA